MSWLLSCIGCGAKNLPEKEEAKILDFQHCSLLSVPPYIFECERCLEELYMDFNQITELPKELFHCHELQILSLGDNDLHNLPQAISSLSNLTTLDLSKNGIADIPDSIKGCKKLRKVNASTNPLCRLPEGFTQLVALKELCLSDTFLEYLPANFGRLIGLEVLELRENQLNTLPRSMMRLTALRRLDLGQNEFTELPEVVGHLTSLTDLWFDNNRVKRIPPEIGNLHQLTFLDASKNRLQEIDPMIGNCKSLTDLFLTTNDLEVLPDSLCVCTKLTVLQVDDNRLEYLPEKIGAFEQLMELKASHNELTSIPYSVGLLRSLQFLHIDDNAIKSLPLEVGSCASLVVLTAAHNELRDLPAEMGNLGKLRVLNLCGNSIHDLPVSFSKLKLTALWLSTNQAKPRVDLQLSNESGSQKVLTCFMLPQGLQRTPSPEQKEDSPLTEADLEARRARSTIHFASDGDKEPLGRLSRIPTPYPKELRALAKHTKNIQSLRKNTSKEKMTKENSKEEMVHLMEAKPKPRPTSSELMELQTSPPSVKLANTITSESTIKQTKTIPLSETKTLAPVNSSPEEFLNQSSESTRSNKFHQNPSLNDTSPTKYNEAKIPHLANTEAPPIGYYHHSREGPHKATHIMVEDGFTAFATDTKKESTYATTNKININDSDCSPTYSVLHHSSPSKTLVPDDPLHTTSSILSCLSAPTKGLTPQRPGSLALEATIPPWHNERPGSLAAPINTVGLPLTSHALRASSQGVLYGSSQRNSSVSWSKEKQNELSLRTNSFPLHLDAKYSVSKFNDDSNSFKRVIVNQSSERESLLSKENEDHKASSSTPCLNKTVECESTKDASLGKNDQLSTGNLDSFDKNEMDDVVEKDLLPSISFKTDVSMKSEANYSSSEFTKQSGNQFTLDEQSPSFMAYSDVEDKSRIPRHSEVQENLSSPKDLSPSFITFSESSSKVVQGTAIYSRIPYHTDKAAPSNIGEQPNLDPAILGSKIKGSITSPPCSGIPQVLLVNKAKSYIPTNSMISQTSMKRELSFDKNKCVESSKRLGKKENDMNTPTDNVQEDISQYSLYSENRQIYNTPKKKETNIPHLDKQLLFQSPTERESNIPIPGKHLYHTPIEKKSSNPISGIPGKQLYHSPNEKESGIPIPGKLLHTPTERVSNIPIPGKQLNTPTERESNIPIPGKQLYSPAERESNIPVPGKQLPHNPTERESSIPIPGKLLYHTPKERESNIPNPGMQLHHTPTERRESNIPISGKQLYHTPPEKESNIPIPGKLFYNSSERENVNVYQGKQTNNSPLEKENCILRTNIHIPLSPVEKPINQTGIPIISPSSTDKSTRIPTFANSSLKGKKSGGAALTQKTSKHQVSPSERRNQGKAWDE